MTRPALPAKFQRGDTVIVRGRQVTDHPTEFLVTGCGPKWLRAVRPDHFGRDHERSYERRFLLTDQTEGIPAQRVGYPSLFATPEQYAYDVETEKARRYVRDVAGLMVERTSPFHDRDRLIVLADALRRILPADA